MAGLFTFTSAGIGFLLLSSIESLLPFNSHLHPLHRLSTLLLSSLFLLYSLISSFLSPPPLSLPLLSLSSFFLLSSLSSFLPLFSPLLPLLSLSSFSLELLFIFLRARLDPAAIESHYFSLLLVPVLICTVSTLVAVFRPNSPAPRLARAAGLALQGTWLVQMGLSLFSTVGIADGCFLKKQSWGEYTVKCKGHPDYHRARAIGTLQFNCHLALMVVVAVGVYGVVMAKRGEGLDSKGYQPLGKETEMVGDRSALRFTLDSDEEVERELEGKMVVVVAEAEGRNGTTEAH